MKVAYVSSYPPRECGVATFTEDLVNSVDKHEKLAPGVVVAVNDANSKYDYDKRVIFQIEKDSIESYIDAASFINDSNVDVVSLQHEFALFGGNKGEFIITFLEKLQKPTVTTLHSVPYPASFRYREILAKIANLSDSLVAIGFNAARILKQEYKIWDNTQIVPHGCPDIPLVNQEDVKASLGLENRVVISTFGLLNSNKGIEYVINALPSIIKRNPKVTYVIIGKTHPEVRKREGERYRNMLITLVDRYGLGEHVIFDNRFLTKKELIKYLQATDIYVVPHTTRDQVSSGTLTYALVAGKAIISTPFPYAQELLSNDCGLLCEFEDSDSIAKCALTILEDDKLGRELETKAYVRGRKLLWSEVAKEYIKLFKEASEKRAGLRTFDGSETREHSVLYENVGIE